MVDTDLEPTRLEPVNGPDDRALVDRLTKDMRDRGWQGRPLLVEEARSPVFGFPRHFAWTGSHRIAAAIAAGLRSVSCRLITADEANDAFARAGYRSYWLNRHSSWRDEVTAAEGPGDRDRLRGLEKAGLMEAVQMLREECDATDGHD